MLALQLGACGVESLDIDGKDRASIYLNCPKLDSPLFEGWEWVGRCGDLTWKNAGDFVFPVWDGLGSASQTQIDTCSL